jgi:hypothetical protein
MRHAERLAIPAESPVHSGYSPLKAISRKIIKFNELQENDARSRKFRPVALRHAKTIMWNERGRACRTRGVG